MGPPARDLAAPVTVFTETILWFKVSATNRVAPVASSASCRVYRGGRRERQKGESAAAQHEGREESKITHTQGVVQHRGVASASQCGHIPEAPVVGRGVGRRWKSEKLPWRQGGWLLHAAEAVRTHTEEAEGSSSSSRPLRDSSSWLIAEGQ